MATVPRTIARKRNSTVRQKGRSLSTHAPFFNHNLNSYNMKRKSNQKRPWFNFTKKRGSTVTILPTDVIVERTKIGAVENIHVIDAEVVEAKRPTFLLTGLVSKFFALWK